MHNYPFNTLRHLPIRWVGDERRAQIVATACLLDPKRVVTTDAIVIQCFILFLDIGGEHICLLLRHVFVVAKHGRTGHWDIRSKIPNALKVRLIPLRTRHFVVSR